MIAAHKDTPAQVLPTNQNIHPGHGIFVVRVGFSVELGRAVITAERNWGGALELRAIPFHHLRLAWFSLPVSNSLNEIGVALKLWA